MRLAIFSSLLFAACASSTPYVQSHPAVARYSATLEQTRAVVHDVLEGRSLHVDAVGQDGFMTGRECRTDGGEVCERRTLWSKEAPPAHTYAFQIGARVVATDGGVIVRVGAVLATGAGPGEPARTMEVGNGEVPAWAQHEVDQVQAEIRHRLAPIRHDNAGT